MNLFNSQVKPLNKAEPTNFADQSVDNISTNKTNRSYIGSIQDILNDNGGGVRMKNENLQKKTEDVQNEFEQLMNEMNSRRNAGMGLTASKLPKDNDFDDEFYNYTAEKKHASPTRRLIQHKNSAADHKLRIHTNINKGDYSQTYCISPGKTYVIEAHGGELNYDLADKSPNRFYNTVLKQDVKKYQVKMRGKITGEWTQRPLLKIISSIKDRIIERIGHNIGEEYEKAIAEALAAGGTAEEHLISMVQNDGVDLVDDNNNLLIQQQRQKGDSAVKGERPASPNATKLRNSSLKINDKQL